MDPAGQATAPSRPQWSANRILFGIEDHGQRVPCAISGAALEDISERRLFRPADFLACFEAARPRIEAVARLKSRARSEGASGPVIVWADDLDDAPDGAATEPPAG